MDQTYDLKGSGLKGLLIGGIAAISTGCGFLNDSDPPSTAVQEQKKRADEAYAAFAEQQAQSEVHLLNGPDSELSISFPHERPHRGVGAAENVETTFLKPEARRNELSALTGGSLLSVMNSNWHLASLADFDLPTKPPSHNPQSVQPEPSTLLAMASGLAGLLLLRRSRSA